MTDRRDSSLDSRFEDLRRRAEDKIRRIRDELGSISVDQGMSADTVREMMYELQVHQVELETTVEELAGTQAELARAREQYRDLYEAAPVGYLSLDQDLAISRANATAAAMLNRSVRDLVGKRLSSFAVPEDRDSCYLFVRKSMRDPGAATADVRFERRGEDRPLHVRLRGVRAEGVPGDAESEWRLAMMNISEAKAAELALEQSEHRLKILNQSLEEAVIHRTEQVHRLARALTLAEQRERKRVSHELHENLQQRLLGARLLLGQHLRDHSAQQSGEWDDIPEAIAELDAALRITKALSVELNPPVLSTEGLDAALRWLADHMRKAYGLVIDLRLGGAVGNVRDGAQLMLTQMVRELLNNVVRHAMVGTALVEVSCEGREVRIVVSDTGRGFDPRLLTGHTVDESRLGLLSIRERLKLFGGDLAIESAPGKGTRITLTLPSEGT